MKKIILMIVCAVASMAAYTAVASETADKKAQDVQSSPQPTIKLSNPQQMIKLCKWYVATINEDTDNIKTELLRKEAAALILQYAEKTQDFTIEIGNKVAPLLEAYRETEPNGFDEPTANLFMGYLACEVAYCLEHHLKRNDRQSYVSSMLTIIDVYSKMKDHPNAALNSYLNESVEKRKQMLEEYWAAPEE